MATKLDAKKATTIGTKKGSMMLKKCERHCHDKESALLLAFLSFFCIQYSYYYVVVILKQNAY